MASAFDKIYSARGSSPEESDRICNASQTRGIDTGALGNPVMACF